MTRAISEILRGSSGRPRAEVVSRLRSYSVVPDSDKQCQAMLMHRPLRERMNRLAALVTVLGKQ